MNDALPFHLWLKKRREALGRSREELAAAAGCSPFTLRKIETGVRRPSRALAERLGDQLQIPADERAAFLAFARSGSTAHPPATPLPPLPRAEALATEEEPPLIAPRPLTRLIGREAYLRASEAMLVDEAARLVTLTGPAGVGKTRLALAVAETLHRHFPGGALFVALAEASGPGEVLPAIAEALGLKGRRCSDELGLREALRDQRMLLVLDNFEQVLDAAPAVATLAADCPGLSLLVTSRAPLAVRGERLLVVAPLALPDTHRTTDPLELEAVPAVALFVERVRALDRAFALSADSAPAVTALCARLDGLPLAIELVAAQARLLTPAAILARLDGETSTLDLLRRGPRDLPERHQTLRAAIAWSYRLLDDGARQAFTRLGCLAEGWTLEDAQAVCTDETTRPAALIDALQTLVESSLVYRPLHDDRERLGMLVTIRAFALEMLEATGDAEAVRRRHAEHFLQVAKESTNLKGAAQARGMKRMLRAQDNLRAALRWALQREEGELAGWLGACVWRFWWMRSQFGEARAWLESILACPTLPDPLRGRILNGLTALAGSQGDDTAARQYGEEGLALVRRLEDPVAISVILSTLAGVLHSQGDVAGARRCYEESLELCRARGDQWRIGTILNNLGTIALGHKEYALARERFGEALAIYRSLGDWHGEALAVGNLGAAGIYEGAYQRALAHYQAAIALHIEMGNVPGAVVLLSPLARIAVCLDCAAEAATLLGAAEGLHGLHGTFKQREPARDDAETLELIQAQIGLAAAADALAAGRGMDFEQVAMIIGDLARADPHRAG